MLVTDRFILVRLPRTGSTWSVRACRAVTKFNPDKIGGGARHSHMTLREAQQVKPKRFFGQLSYVQVRHPLTWLGSVYAWMTRSQKWRHLPGKVGEHINPERHLWTFESFMDWYITQRPGHVTQIFDAYTDGVDRIGRQEHATHDLANALRDAGYMVHANGFENFAPINVSQNAVDRYTPEQAEALYQSDSSVYERFGYYAYPSWMKVADV